MEKNSALRRKLALIIASGATLAVVGACSAGGETAAPAPTVTVTETPTPTAPIVVPPVVEPPAPTKQAQSSKITVPNGVGKNYQAAQDVWRAAGLTVLPAEDATGAGRLPVLDSGWVVLSQTPKAGTQVSDSDATITATVKKYSDR
jgi:hypothetical protein